MIKIDLLLNLPDTKTYPQGSMLLEEGFCSSEGIYVLLKGIASAYENYQQYNENRLQTFSPVTCFGEMTMFSNEPSPVVVVAMTEVALLKINRENAAGIFEKHPELAVLIIESLCKRLHMLNPNMASKPKKQPVDAPKPALEPVPPAAKEAAVPPPEKKAEEKPQEKPEEKPQEKPEEKPQEKPEEKQQEKPEEKPQKNKDVTPTVKSAPSALFPKGHGSYLLPMENDKPGYLYEQDITCPLCGHSFSQITALSSRLRLSHMDSDFRQHYKELEPMHYDIITCPKCLYSTPADMFDTVTRSMSDMVDRELKPYKKSVVIKTGKQRDTFTVFAGYYLALLCIPVCFDDFHIHTAKLWLKLSRIYADCNDSTMYNYTLNKSLEDYRYAYLHYKLNEKTLHQVRYVLGDLYEKLGDIDNSRQFFYMVKVDRNINRVLGRQADQRLEAIRERLHEKKP